NHFGCQQFSIYTKSRAESALGLQRFDVLASRLFTLVPFASTYQGFYSAKHPARPGALKFQKPSPAPGAFCAGLLERGVDYNGSMSDSEPISVPMRRRVRNANWVFLPRELRDAIPERHRGRGLGLDSITAGVGTSMFLGPQVRLSLVVKETGKL